MAIYTDFFVAEPDEIPRLFFPNDLRRRPTVLAKNILPDALADLDFILTGASDREPRLVRESGESLVYELAGELVSGIAELPDDRLSDLSEEWGHSDERVLRELQMLAQEACAHGKRLYVYM